MSSNSPPINLQFPNPEFQSSSKSYALRGRIMLVSITILFAFFLTLLFLHLFSRWYLLRLHHNHRRRNRHNRRNSIVLHINTDQTLASHTAGLDASVLKSLPLFVYSPEQKSGTECAVCLSEFEMGETGRVLPGCGHRFHIQCIDMWFFSHSTCPICRAPVQAVNSDSEEVKILDLEELPEPGSCAPFTYPFGPEDGGTTSFGERMKRVDVRIDVPNRPDRSELVSENELRSPGNRLFSLKRIMSMGRKSPAGGGGGPVAGELDVESTSQESSGPGSVR